MNLALLNIAKINLYRMEQAASSGDWKTFEVLFAQQLATSIGIPREGAMLHHLVSIATIKMLQEELAVILANTKPPLPTLGRMLIRVRQAEQQRVSAEDMWRYEWKMFEPYLRAVLAGKEIEENDYIQPDIFHGLEQHMKLGEDTVKNVANLWTYAIHESSQRPPKAPVLERWLAQNAKVVGSGAIHHKAEDPTAHMVAHVLLNSAPKVQKDFVISELTTASMRVQIALEAFHQTQGRYPKTLRELTPTFLTKVPTDFSAVPARPITYRTVTKGYLLYGFGQNGVNDGGKPRQKGNTEASDVRFVPSKRSYK